MKEKVGGSGVGDSASRWSTRQASLFYRRQNNRSFPCRRIPSLFSDVKVLTDADLIKESQGESENMVDEPSSTIKRPSASCDHKTKQEQVNKARETSGRKTSLSSQVDVKSSKSGTSVKRKSSSQDNCDRPSKRKPQMVKVVSKGVQKHPDKKQSKGENKSPKKTKVGNGSARSYGSKNTTTKNAKSSTHYKVLMTRPCSVPVVPVGSPPRADQQRPGTVLVLKKVFPSTHPQPNRLPPRKSLASIVTNLSDKNVNKNLGSCAEDQENDTDKTDLEVTPKPGIEENKDMNISEINVIIKTESVVKSMTDNVDSGLAADESIGGDINNSTHAPPTSGFQNQSQEPSSENKRVNDNSLPNDDGDCTETRESKTESVTIKRSARISERKANTIAELISKFEKSQRNGNSSEESKLVKGDVGSDPKQSKTVSKVLNHDILNPTLKAENAATLTQGQHLQRKSVSTSNTKYTQRMTWQLQPQVTPIDKINPVSVGDIVWGKVHGHPWWPGKVLAISGIRNEDSKNLWDRDAHVSWFGSNTSSIMRLHGLQLFLPNFAKRHKRHKKGFYRVAVRQAEEALQAMSGKD